MKEESSNSQHPSDKDQQQNPTVLTRLFRTIALLATIGTICAWLSMQWWVFELASHFRFQIGLGFLVCTFFFVIQRHIPQAIFCTVMLLHHGFAVAPAWIAKPAPRPNGPIITGLLANVEGINRNHKALLDLIQQQKPDLIILVEVRHHWSRAIQPLRKTYRHVQVLPRRDNFGLAVLSKYPITSAKYLPLGTDNLPTLQAHIRIRKKQLVLFATHFDPPISQLAAQFRNEQAEQLAQQAKNTKLPTMICGDLNMSPWSPYFTKLLGQSGLQDSRKGFGLQSSWPTKIPLLLTPIDHILHSPTIRIVKREIGPSIGSDHYPVLFAFQFSSTASPTTQTEK